MDGGALACACAGPGCLVETTGITLEGDREVQCGGGKMNKPHREAESCSPSPHHHQLRSDLSQLSQLLNHLSHLSIMAAFTI